MSAGLATLTELKRRLLGASVRTQSTWDDTIREIGLGVLGLFETFTNRKFTRLVGAQDEFSADRRHWILSRYPVEAITAVELRSDMASGWVSLGAVNDAIWQRSDAAGMIWFGALQGDHTCRLRVTYTGGYWWNTSEPAENQPAGSALLPHDLREAFYLQCEHVWERRDKLGVNLTSEAGVEPRGREIAIEPAIASILRGHIRYCVS